MQLILNFMRVTFSLTICLLISLAINISLYNFFGINVIDLKTVLLIICSSVVNILIFSNTLVLLAPLQMCAVLGHIYEPSAQVWSNHLNLLLFLFS